MYTGADLKLTEFVFPWFSKFLASRKVVKNLSVVAFTRLYWSPTDVTPAPDGPGIDMLAVACSNVNWSSSYAANVHETIAIYCGFENLLITKCWCYLSIVGSSKWHTVTCRRVVCGRIANSWRNSSGSVTSRIGSVDPVRSKMISLTQPVETITRRKGAKRYSVTKWIK